MAQGWSGSDHGLVARDDELRSVRRHLTSGGRVLTVLGMAGAGKTALLTAAAAGAAAEGWLVLRLRGRATEAKLGFATLLDLLDAADAPDPETAALAGSVRERVLGGGTPDALRLRRDVHQWLLALAPDELVLVLVDDAQWVDPASWLVLSFVANRLADSTVSVLLASRTDAPAAGLEDQPVLHLAPLVPAAAAELLERVGLATDPVVRSAVVQQAAGNPLALLELARVGSGAVPSATRVHPTVPAAIEAAFAAELPALPDDTRWVLLLAAAGGTDLAVLARAVGDTGDVMALLEPAERADLVRVGDAQVSFRHPLVEAAVYGLAGARQRRRAHARLADLFPVEDDRHVWHLAAATEGPDEAVATALLASAERMRDRGAQEEAADAVVRAAELTADPDLRDERMLNGLSLSTAVGHVHRLSALAAHFRRRSTHPVVRAKAAQLHAYVLAQTMQQASAQDMLQVALEEMIKVDDVGGWASLTTLASLTYQTCRRREVLAHWLERYEAITPHDFDDQPLNAAARLWIIAALDPVAPPAEVRQRLRTAPDLPSGAPAHLAAPYEMLLGATAWVLDDPGTALQRLGRSGDLMRLSGAVQQLPQNVMTLGQVQFDTGRYDDADRSGRQLVDLSEAYGLPYYRAAGRELRARVAAVRGEPDAVATLDALLTGTEPGQSVSLEANLLAGRALALSAQREHEAAYQQWRGLFDADGTPLHPHVSLRSLGELAAAADRVDRLDDVVAIVRGAEGQLTDLPGQRLTRVLARAKAHLAGDAAGPLYERAVHEGGAADFPFERAGAQLEYGGWLRRQRRATDARDHLRSAHQTFTRIGATAWAAMAEAELRAAGVRADGDHHAARWAALTAQEREIVRLAATGLSNKEIGQALFLSPRTVGAHLYHAFPKLGVTARSQLRDVVDGGSESRD
ncbi:AAA family ATPase [Nocardioides anomalus]|uniref:AAA family ATPase n=1 Tax=Nocardioides anomalus TaxID=2712223 RepID=A0A6G6WKN1_9ACTN|nr:LuxR family transcriptional regulator [Nocardioides anomalus]QIG45655.1 AAA family ATPase [Nocardioides anomalus]